jgi:hypothetical protein
MLSLSNRGRAITTNEKKKTITTEREERKEKKKTITTEREERKEKRN